MKINTNLETLVAVHTHTHTHTDVQLENKNAQNSVASEAIENNFESKNYNIRNNIKKGVNSLCIQIHKLSLLSFLRLLKNYVLQLYQKTNNYFYYRCDILRGGNM